MVDDPRICAVTCLINDYVRSPSLKHIRDSHSISKLTRDIVRRLDGGTRTWRKWTDQRELLLKSALTCWVPEEDLRAFLNSMPGPALTRTDVAQRQQLYRVETLDPHEKGVLLGTYQRRGDATKAVKEMAYLPEPRRG